MPSNVSFVVTALSFTAQMSINGRQRSLWPLKRDQRDRQGAEAEKLRMNRKVKQAARGMKRINGPISGKSFDPACRRNHCNEYLQLSEQ
ncbi:hypothetical protein [Chlorobium phaeobacteroides]|nr:hypothetical protein [Chlorobium phaeobacteroides]